MRLCAIAGHAPGFGDHPSSIRVSVSEPLSSLVTSLCAHLTPNQLPCHTRGLVGLCAIAGHAPGFGDHPSSICVSVSEPLSSFVTSPCACRWNVTV